MMVTHCRGRWVMNRSENTVVLELVDSRDAVWHYLDALLQDIPDDPGPVAVGESPPASAPLAEAVQESAAVEAPLRSLFRQEPPSDPAARREVADPEPDPVAPVAKAEPASAEPEGLAASPQDWVDREFLSLFFYVAGLRLAVPLTELHSVVPWSDVGVTAIPNHPSWFMGLMPYRERKVRVIDTAAMVLPESMRYASEARAEPDHILVVGDGSWGLACHGIGDVVRLQPDEVKWRTCHSKRPWLAGTVIGHLCALVDTAAFADMLAGTASTSPVAGRYD